MNLYGNDKLGVYFQETSSGNWTIVRSDGTKKTIRRRPEHLEDDRIRADWQRAQLYMDECGIWDATAFGCTMSTFILFPIEGDRGFTCFLLFASSKSAEEKIYPFLTREEINTSRNYVDSFYSNPGVQCTWEGLILHPVNWPGLAQKSLIGRKALLTRFCGACVSEARLRMKMAQSLR